MDLAERDLREELARTAVQAYHRGLVAGSGGNVSARIPGRDEVLITPTGVSLGMTTVENIVKTDLYATQLSSATSYRPSKETGFHCAVYRTLPAVNAVVHVHPPYATAFSLRNRDLPLVTVSASVNLKLVPCIEVSLSGSGELRGYVEETFTRYPGIKAALMRAHGIIAIGADLASAYNVADLVEDTAEIAFLSDRLGIPLEDSVKVAFLPVPAEARLNL
jgi:L-ribulose-5-phosphate 4-epimerase